MGDAPLSIMREESFAVDGRSVGNSSPDGAIGGAAPRKKKAAKAAFLLALA
jgi:hypothetical protein